MNSSKGKLSLKGIKVSTPKWSRGGKKGDTLSEDGKGGGADEDGALTWKIQY